MNTSNQNNGFFHLETVHDFVLNTLENTGTIFSKDVFALMLPVIPDSFLLTFVKKILQRTDALKMNVSYLSESLESGEDDCREVIEELFGKKAIRKRYEKHLINAFRKSIRTMKQEHNEKDRRIHEISTIFNLSEIETRILNLFFLKETDMRVSNLVSALNDHFSLCTNDLIEKNTSILLSCSANEIRRAFAWNSNLIRSRILDEERDLSKEIEDYLLGLNDKPLLQNYYMEYEGAILSPESYFISPEALSIIRDLFYSKPSNQAIHILLHGKPGTGKTAFARTLSAHIDVPLYEIKNMDDSYRKQNTHDFRLRALQACSNMVDSEKAVILIDEADTLLNTIPRFFMFKETTEKGLINTVLDHSSTFNIWIINYPDAMDESTLRRFDYTLEFRPLTHQQREKIWQSLLKKAGLLKSIDPKQVSLLAGMYELSAGKIAKAVKNTAAIYQKNPETYCISDALETFLQSYASQSKTGLSMVRQTNRHSSKQFTLKGLNTDTDLTQTIGMVKQFIRKQQNRNNIEPQNFNMLFYGPSGTGKTQFARYLARTMDNKLILKTAADLLSHWVGMTEKQIREAFQEAEQENAILFFDEIDSLLLSRSQAGHSWEVTQVNELLTCMEQFKGIFLAATNYKDLMDHAAMRRFMLKIHFDYLTGEGNILFYRRYFSDLVNTNLLPAENKMIQSLHFLTPGDFNVIRAQYSYMEIKHLTHMILIDALKKEIKNKKIYTNPIGFN